MGVMGRSVDAAAAHDVRAHRARVQAGKRSDDLPGPEGPSPALSADPQGDLEDALVDRHGVNIHVYIPPCKAPSSPSALFLADFAPLPLLARRPAALSPGTDGSPRGVPADFRIGVELRPAAAGRAVEDS